MKAPSIIYQIDGEYFLIAASMAGKDFSVKLDTKEAEGMVETGVMIETQDDGGTMWYNISDEAQDKRQYQDPRAFLNAIIETLVSVLPVKNIMFNNELAMVEMPDGTQFTLRSFLLEKQDIMVEMLDVKEYLVIHSEQEDESIKRLIAITERHIYSIIESSSPSRIQNPYFESFSIEHHVTTWQDTIENFTRHEGFKTTSAEFQNKLRKMVQQIEPLYLTKT